MGRVGKQPPGEVLHADGRRQEAASDGGHHLAEVRDRDLQGARRRIGVNDETTSPLARLFRYPSRTSEDIRHGCAGRIRFSSRMRRADALEKEGLSRAEARAARRARVRRSRTGGAAACVREGEHLEARRTLAMLGRRDQHRPSLRHPRVTRLTWLSFVIVLTLAVAIAGNTAVFTIVDSLLFKPPSFAEPSRLVRIYTGESQVSWANLEDIRQRSTRVRCRRCAQRAVAPAVADRRQRGRS